MAGATEPEYAEEEIASGGGHRFLYFNAMPSSMVSAVVHAVLLIVLALVTFKPPEPPQQRTLAVAEPASEELEEMEEVLEVPEMDLEDVVETDVPVVNQIALPDAPITPDIVEAPSMDQTAAPAEMSLVEFSDQTAPKSDLMASVGAVTGTGLSGRGAAMRGQLVKKNGGSEGSEAAVALALKWLALHQMPDGGWSFNHALCPTCAGKCPHPGSMAPESGRNGATALALLPFLGAGQTHVEGEYQQVVKAGLYFLMTRQNPQTGSFHEGGGNMYSHGLCSIVMCEAYAMTHDKALMLPAQACINFIAAAQDPVGGGWRYAPQQPGDTSVVGWQLMALKSGHMAYLQVPPPTVVKAMRFLDIVQSDSGAKYGYTGPGEGPSTSAVGLLCRMYLGWKKEHPALARGVKFISNRGPILNGNSANMYYNYYATQVCRQFGGDEWKAWNEKMRDPLIALQSKAGHATGSWHFEGGDHGSDVGGRVYSTAMATMILEVYYRHMPIYQENASKDDFPL